MAVKVKERNGAWWLYIDHKGVRKAKRVGTGTAGKQAAETASKVIAAKLALGETDFLSVEPARLVTLKEYGETWLATHVKGRLKSGTHDWYARTLRAHWLPILGSRPLGAITREPIRAALSGWLAAGVASGTVRGRLIVLQACFASAIEDGHVKVNPTARLGKWTQKTEAQAKQVVIFSREELREIFEAATRVKPEWATSILLLARTGLRLGEALTLKWEDLDLAKRRLTVQRTWTGGSRRLTNAPKGNKSRIVDVSGQLASALLKHRDQQQVDALLAGTEPTPWVFVSRKGEPLRRGAWWTRVWAPVLKEAGVPYRNPHTLRHTFASLLLAQGESLAYVRDQLGHASIKLTVDLYGHFVPGANRAAVDKLDDVEVARATDATTTRLVGDRP